MAHSYPDRHLCGLWRALVAAGALLCLLTAHAANDKGLPIDWSGDNPRANANAGTLSLDKPEVRQGSTLLRADKSDATGLVDGKAGNSIWKFTGAVHLEFDNAVLDAQAATVVFADGHMKSLDVPAPPAQVGEQQKSPMHLEFRGALLDAQTATVTFADDRMKAVQVQGAPGAPAQFSHQLKNSHRVRGHADRIDYDADKNMMRLSGNTWYADDNTQFEIPALNYNLTDGSYTGEGRSHGTWQPDDGKVPAPRTPDRASAK